MKNIKNILPENDRSKLVNCNGDDFFNKKDKPKDGKTYALTGAKDDKCIANGYSWKDSEVK